MEDILQNFLAWAWERHHNPLSWYIRPLFSLPFCYFAYKRNVSGMMLTLIGLATSMFWFPKPDQIDPQAAAFLEMERQYLTGQWTLLKILIAIPVPLMFILLGWAFWNRSWMVGVTVINLAAITKCVWSFYYGAETAWSLIPTAIINLLICNLVLFYTYRRIYKLKNQDNSKVGR
jgi:hypothetical protein